MVIIHNDRKRRRNCRFASSTTLLIGTIISIYIGGSCLSSSIGALEQQHKVQEQLQQLEQQQQQQQRLQPDHHGTVPLSPRHEGIEKNVLHQGGELSEKERANGVSLKTHGDDAAESATLGEQVDPPPPLSAAALRGKVLQLLQNLPNNATQRQMPRAIVPRKDHQQKGVITLTTQGGTSKLPRLVDLAGRWLGPISFGYYISSADHLDALLIFVEQNDLIQQFVTFHFLMEQPQMPLTVNRHPINRLRNLALKSAETDVVFINDVDFMPPAGAHDAIAPRISQLPPKTFWVLPAFERFGTANRGPGRFVDDVNMIPANKKDLAEAVAKKEVAPFHEYFPPGHGPSDYNKWYTATEMYQIQYDYLFEPYVIVRKEGLPQFFPTFRGFGFNKMVFFMEAFYMGGFTYKVLPDQYVVHMNHGGRKGRNDKGGNSEYIKEDFRKYLTKVYGVTQKELVKWK